eukprot:3934049-Rhodomonas_salina.1
MLLAYAPTICSYRMLLRPSYAMPSTCQRFWGQVEGEEREREEEGEAGAREGVTEGEREGKG